MRIIIVHHKTTEKFLPALVRSLNNCIYPVSIIHNDGKIRTSRNGRQVYPNPNGGFELGALRAAMELFPQDDQFFLMQESLIVKDQEVFDIAAEAKGSLAVCDGFCHFLGKYKRKVLEQTGIPSPTSRTAEICYEYFWNLIYINTEGLENLALLADTLPTSSTTFETKFGRKNMVLENRYIKKWKSNWGQDGPYLKIPAGMNEWMPKIIR